MLERILFTSLPNYASILVSAGLFCSVYQLREPAARRLGAWGLACLAMSVGSTLIHRVLVPAVDASVGAFFSLPITCTYFVLVLLACVPLAQHAFEVGRWDALFCVTAGYALQNLAHALWEILANLFFDDGLSAWLSAVLQLALTAAVFFAAYLTVIRHIRVNRLKGEADRRMVAVLVSVVLVNIVLDILARSLHEEGALGNVSFLVLRISLLVAGALTLLLDYEILFSNRMRADAAATRQLMEDQRRQYELSRETIEAINVRCHDIRHQVRALSGPGGGERAFVEEIDGLISIYDRAIQTGNEALDVILTEKSLLCQRRGIELTCTADGRALDFMAEQDVYSLFGNALDNAIDAVGDVRDAGRRLIDVIVRTMGGMAVVQVRNFYEGELRREGDELRSTKGGGLHGYGTRSMRLVAERYGGSVSFEADEGIFRLHVLLPRPR